MAGPVLSATLEAKLDQYQRDMRRAGDIADQAVSDIEQKFRNSNPSVPLAGVFGGIAGAGAVIGFLAFLREANKEMEDLVNNAKLLGLSIERLQELRFAGNLGGLSNEDFVNGLTKMAELLNDAQRNENSLTKLLDENNIKYKDRNGQLISINQMLGIANNLIHNAGTELDKVEIAKMVGVTKEWIPALDMSSQEFTKIAAGAQAAGAVISTETVLKAAEFSRAWSISAARWAVEMKAAVAEMLPFIDDLIRKSSDLIKSIASIGGEIAHESDTMGRALDAAGMALADFMTGRISSESLLGVLRDVANNPEKFVSATARIKEGFDALAKSGPLKLTVNPDPTKIPEKGTDTSDVFDREIDRLKRHIAAMEADAVAVGRTAGEHERLRAELVLLQAAEKVNDDMTVEQIDTYTRLRATMGPLQALQAAGIKLTNEQAEAFAQIPGRAAIMGDSLRKAQMDFQGLNDTMRFGGSQLVNVLDAIGDHTKSMADVGVQALGALKKALLEAAVFGAGPLAQMLGMASPIVGGTGGALGFLASAFGFGGGPGGKGIGGAAGGTDNSPGGWTEVGENGPELLNLPQGTRVLPNSALERMGGGGSPQVTLHQTLQFQPGISGSDMAMISSMITQSSQQTIGAVLQAIRIGKVNDPHFLDA